MKRINIYQVTTLLLALAFIALAYSKVGSNNETAMDKKTAVLETIHNRKSVRRYTERPVSKEDLMTLVKAGMAAPSAKNVQSWAFVIVTNRTALDAIAEQLPFAKMLKQASSAIVVCGDMTKVDDPAKSLWYQDCSAAAENILLAAEAMDLGAVWTAAYPYEDRMKVVREALSLPETTIPLNVIPVGYPAGEDKPRDKWKEENVRWEKW